MLKLVEADSLPYRGPQFRTAGSAIDAGRKSMLEAQNDPILAPLRGKAILRIEWCDDEIRLHFLDGNALRIEVAEGEHELSISSPPPDLPMAGTSEFEDIVTLELGGRQSTWRRGDLMRSLEGKTFGTLLRQGGPFNFLYVRDSPILMLGALVRRGSKKPFLYWGPDG